MAFNGAGVFNRLYSWVTDRGNGIKIDSTRMDAEMDGMATGLTTCITKDGQTTVTANLPMATFRHTGVGNAAARTDYAATGQVQDGSFLWCGTATGTADAITLTPSPAITAYAAGQTFRFISSAANTGAVTVAVSGLAAKAVTKSGTTALVANDILSGAVYDIVYDGTQFQVNLVIPANLVTTDTAQTISGNKTLSGANTHTGLNTFSTTAALSVPITIRVTDDGGLAGPRLDLYRDSASPAANDYIAVVRLFGKNSAGNNTSYADILGTIVDPTNASERGRLTLRTTQAGAETSVATLEQGVQVGAPAGGDKGVGTLNATGLYVNNVALGTLAWANFTPTVTLVGGTGNTVPVYSTNAGRYIRVGNYVHAEVYLTGDGGAEGTGTGRVHIALPVAASASQNGSDFPCGTAVNGATFFIVTGEVAASGTTIGLAYFDTISTIASFTGANQNNATRTIRLSFSYEA